MNIKRRILKPAGLRLAVILTTAALLGLSATSCEIYTRGHSDDRRGHDDRRGDHHGDQDYSGDYYFSCSMHRDVRRSGPGSCPRCGMSLIRIHMHDDRR